MGTMGSEEIWGSFLGFPAIRIIVFWSLNGILSSPYLWKGQYVCDEKVLLLCRYFRSPVYSMKALEPSCRPLLGLGIRRIRVWP